MANRQSAIVVYKDPTIAYADSVDQAANIDSCQYNPTQGWPDLHDSRFKNKDNFAVNNG